MSIYNNNMIMIPVSLFLALAMLLFVVALGKGPFARNVQTFLFLVLRTLSELWRDLHPKRLRHWFGVKRKRRP